MEPITIGLIGLGITSASSVVVALIHERTLKGMRQRVVECHKSIEKAKKEDDAETVRRRNEEIDELLGKIKAKEAKLKQSAERYNRRQGTGK